MKNIGKSYWTNKKIRNESGVTIILVAICLTVLIGMAALAVDIGYLLGSRNELQNAADASALAATRKLGSIYEPMSYTAQQSYVCDPNAIIPVAQATAASNMAAMQSVTVLSADVVIGTWDPTTKVLTQTLNQPDAVRVTTRRDNTPGVGGRVGTFFARIFGQNEVDVSATATAALTALSKVAPGELELPVGISTNWFAKGYFCGEKVTFAPTSDSCAGWTKFDSVNKSVPDSDFRKLLQDMINGTFTSPEVIAGTTPFGFTGGKLSKNSFDKMEELFNLRKNAAGIWETTVVVYREPNTGDKCSNPNQLIVIDGFATIYLREVNGPSSKNLEGTVICDKIDAGRGSGGNFGTKGSIPGLVQ